MSFKKEKKIYTESEITLTDINEPMAYLISSHQMLLSTHSMYKIGDISEQRRNVKSTSISSTYYTRMAIIEALHPLERSKGQKKNKNLSDTDTSMLLLHMHELKFKRKEAISSVLFFLFHFIILFNAKSSIFLVCFIVL